MPVELRKRKPREAPPAPAPPAKKKAAATKAKPAPAKVAPAKKAAAEKPAPKKKGDEKKDKPAAPAASKAPAVGETIMLEGFGGELETHDGKKTTLKELVGDSEGGVVLFTYPKASTPGCRFPPCPYGPTRRGAMVQETDGGIFANTEGWPLGTKQVCFFRDSYDPITKAGFTIYGLSADSGKANTTFKTKQNLQYSLLCDVKATLIAAIGLKKGPSGTQRGVFVVDKEGKVLIAEPGSPQGTVDAVLKLVEGKGEANGDDEKGDDKEEEENKDGDEEKKDEEKKE
jgi:thioredoxin-dependent peroxiredoxin